MDLHFKDSLGSVVTPILWSHQIAQDPGGRESRFVAYPNPTYEIISGWWFGK